MPVTIRDVARRLDLSVTTVSRALAGYDDVAETTRQRVITAAREMGYMPQYAARQLRRQRTETIGIVFPTMGTRFSDPFFGEFMAGVGDEASRRNYDLLVSVAPAGISEQDTYQRLVNSRRVDGFVLARMRIEDWRISYLLHEEVPFVSFGRSETDEKAPHIGVDGCAGICELVRHLVSLGNRRIAFIGAPPVLTLSRDREEGYRKGMREAGIDVDPDLMSVSDLTSAGGYETAKKLLEHDPAPTAIIGVNDLTALGVIRAAQERGLSVGEDIAIAGFDGIETGKHWHPPLTTVYQPVYEIGRRVSDMLVAIIEGKETIQIETLIQPKLIIRQSTVP